MKNIYYDQIMSNYQSDVQEVEKLIFARTGKTKENAYFLLTNLSSEVGELADELVGLEGERIEDVDYEDKNEAAKEIVDVIFNAVRIANHYGIDLEKYWQKRMLGLKKKFE